MLQQVKIDFNQRKLIEFKINFKQALLLNYIMIALADPEMLHGSKDGVSYVWLQHSKILEDLPYIDTSIPRLRQILAELVDMGLIKTDQVINDLHGSKVFYTITEKCKQLIFESPKMETQIETRVAKNGASDNKPPINIAKHSSPKTLKASQLASKAPATETEKKKEEKKEKGKKVDLYSKCVQYIMEYTDYFKLQKALVRYLDVLLEVHRSEKKAMYFNMFVGKLNRLSTFPEDDRLEIVELATSNGWKNFYPLNNNSKPSKKGFNDVAVSEHYTEEELAKLNELEEERKAHGLQTKF